MSSFDRVTNIVTHEMAAREPSTVYVRITGKQSVERLCPLFEELNRTSASHSLRFLPIGTHPNNDLLSVKEMEELQTTLSQPSTFAVWETTCEKELLPLHHQACIRNKLLNNTVIESKANFAFLQQLLPSELRLPTFVARSGHELRSWASRRWSFTLSSPSPSSSPSSSSPSSSSSSSSSPSSSTSIPDTSDWWVVKASTGNGGRDIWLIHASNHMHELASLPDAQEYVIQQYVAKPMLYLGKKKFHFRCYALMTAAHAAFVCQHAFVLTAGWDFSNADTDVKRHITNLSINKHLPLHPGQIPCHLPTEYAELYPRIQHLWRETVAAATTFMSQPSQSLNFEFCGLDVIADETGACYLIEINRLPGLESSKINTAEEDRMYDSMMREVLQRMYLQPLLLLSQRHFDSTIVSCNDRNNHAQRRRQQQHPEEEESMWDHVYSPSQSEPAQKANGNGNGTQQEEEASRSDGQAPTAAQVTLNNLLRWKMFVKKQRALVLAEFN